MRRLLCLTLLLATFCLAADFTGEWSGSGLINHQKQPFYFIFWEDGSTLNGSGGSDLSNQDVILNGKVDGSKVTFDLAPEGKIEYHFELSIDGAGLVGTYKYEETKESVSGTISLTRAPD